MGHTPAFWYFPSVMNMMRKLVFLIDVDTSKSGRAESNLILRHFAGGKEDMGMSVGNSLGSVCLAHEPVAITLFLGIPLPSI